MNTDLYWSLVQQKRLYAALLRRTRHPANRTLALNNYNRLRQWIRELRRYGRLL